MERLSIIGTYRELREIQKTFKESQTNHPLQIPYITLTLNQRINYKGWNELKGKHYGSQSKLGQRELYFRMHELQVSYSLCIRNIRYIGESTLFKRHIRS
jgi:hypothetical protein